MKPPNRKRKALEPFTEGGHGPKKQKSPLKSRAKQTRRRLQTSASQETAMDTLQMSTKLKDEKKTVKTSPPEFGLISKDKEVTFVESKIHVTIQGFMANVESKLTYVNNEPDPIEVRYVFPIDDMSAVYKFEADINGKHIVAECQDKQQAKVTYVEAVSSGKTAMILSEVKTSGDVFKCQLGNLPPGETAQLTMDYVVELTVEPDGRMKFDLPVVLNPRYTPQHIGEEIDTSYDQSEQPAKMTFTASVNGHHKIRNIISYTDGFICKIYDDRVTAWIELDDDLVPDKDFSFSIMYNDMHKPEAIIEMGDPNKDGLLKENLVMINFFPDLKIKKNVKREFVFLMDRSGSMTGDKIQRSSEALFLFLKSLPVGCLFNIVCFGSDYEFLFKRSKPYNKKNLEKALDLQNSMEADMGGTEILLPLLSIFSQKCNPDYPRQVFMLTDGEVANTDDIVSVVRGNSRNSRVFTFGIGNGCSTSLIKNVAKAGNGTATFIKNDSDNMKAMVITALQHSMEDCMTNIDVEWNLPKGYTTTKIPTQLPCIIVGDMVVMFVILQSKRSKKSLSGSLTLKGVANGLEFAHTLDLKMPTTCNPDLPIHRIAAKRQIKELELEEIALRNDKCWRNDGFSVERELNGIKQKISLVSQSANVISKYTSFVGVDVEATDQNASLNCAVMINVFLKTLSRKCTSIQLSNQSLVEDLKDMIWEKEGVPPDQQLLIFYGVRLEDRRTLSDYGVKNESTIHLVLRLRGDAGDPLLLYNPIPQPSPCLPPYGEFETSTDLSSSPAKNDAKDKKEISVFVKTLTGNTITIHPPNFQTTVRSFKVAIAKKEGIDPDEQRLIFQGMQLDDRHSMDHYKIMEESTLHLVLRLRGGGPSSVDMEEDEEEQPDDMLKLIDLQRFDGCWTYSKELVEILKVKRKILKKNQDGYQQNVWCTALAICYLKKMFIDRSDEWTMIEDKAVSWLKSKNINNIDELFKLAVKAIGQFHTS